MFMLFALCLSICHLYSYILAPSNRSPLKAFVDLNVSGGDLLEGAGIYIYISLFECISHKSLLIIVSPSFLVESGFEI